MNNNPKLPRKAYKRNKLEKNIEYDDLLGCSLLKVEIMYFFM